MKIVLNENKVFGSDLVVGHPEHDKKSVGIFEYNLASMLIVYLGMF